jgi:hypothetical protein
MARGLADRNRPRAGPAEGRTEAPSGFPRLPTRRTPTRPLAFVVLPRAADTHVRLHTDRGRVAPAPRTPGPSSPFPPSRTGGSGVLVCAVDEARRRVGFVRLRALLNQSSGLTGSTDGPTLVGVVKQSAVTPSPRVRGSPPEQRSRQSASAVPAGSTGGANDGRRAFEVPIRAGRRG